MARAILVVLDSFGIGGAGDADRYGDAGANTLGHIAAACVGGLARPQRQGPLHVPNMERLGLGLAARAACGKLPAGFMPEPPLAGICACASEVSSGKDTPSGHWEIAGVPVPFKWGYFPRTVPCFPKKLTDAIVAQGNLPGILGNRHASGTEIIEELGAEHISSGKPICYTSADSVFQIAAHEVHFGLPRLLDLCKLVRRLVGPLRIGRVIARPFVGERPGQFERTGNRKDFAVPPPEDTLLDRAKAAGREVVAVGKIDDIFAHRGMTKSVKAHGNDALLDATIAEARAAPDGALVFANLIDFDSLYGHRRDVAGYAGALEHFDRRLPELLAILRPGDLLTLTADHGNDPTWAGSDHTREQVPALLAGPGVAPANAGRRGTFSDIGESIAAHLGLPPGRHGRSFLKGRR
jgi:phosphopentomutase